MIRSPGVLYSSGISLQVLQTGVSIFFYCLNPMREVSERASYVCLKVGMMLSTWGFSISSELQTFQVGVTMFVCMFFVIVISCTFWGEGSCNDSEVRNGYIHLDE